MKIVRTARQSLLVSAGAAAAGLTFAAAAWACTPINEGATSVTPDEGAPGTVVTATASLSLPGPWPLLFVDPSLVDTVACHHGEPIGEGQGIQQQGGKYQVTGTGVIPPATPGVAEICYSLSATRISGADTFTVVGLP